MIEYRRIKLLDVPAITDLAVKALTPSQSYPLHLDRAKVQKMVEGFAIDRSHYNMAAFKDEKPVGGIALYVVESPFFERHEGHVVMAFSEEPGTGARLIRLMMDWVKADMRVRRVVWSMNEACGDNSIAARFGRMVKRRYGFASRHDNLVFYKE